MRSGPWPEEATDASLLDRVARNDRLAYAALVKRHLPIVLAVARRMLRDDAEAEDVAQEAMLRLWKHGGELEIGGNGVAPWLRRVTANLCIDRVRVSQRYVVTDEVPEVPEEATQEKSIEQQDVATRVTTALNDLPERQRIALALFHYEGRSQKEIGEVMGISDEAVESLISRARRKLKQTLAPDWQHLIGNV